MFMDFVNYQHCNKLCDSGKQQVGVQSLFVLGFTSCNTKTVLEVVDGFFNGHSDFIGGIPFIRTTDCTGIGTQIFLRINIEHSAAGRFCTGIFTMTDTFAFTGFLIIYPFHFGTHKLHGREPAA